jgi:hypothetical protein
MRTLQQPSWGMSSGETGDDELFARRIRAEGRCSARRLLEMMDTFVRPDRICITVMGDSTGLNAHDRKRHIYVFSFLRQDGDRLFSLQCRATSATSNAETLPLPPDRPTSYGLVNGPPSAWYQPTAWGFLGISIHRSWTRLPSTEHIYGTRKP